METNIAFNNLFDTKQKKLAFFQNIVLVAIADRHIDEMESDFLINIGNQLELTAEDTLSITDNLSTLSFILPEGGHQKSLELQTLVMLMLQDGEIEEREYNMCLDFTNKIGFDKQMLDELIKKVSRS